jgi:hypothetical protein
MVVHRLLSQYCWASGECRSPPPLGQAARQRTDGEEAPSSRRPDGGVLRGGGCGGLIREHGDAGAYAAIGISSTSRSIPGYQRLKMARSSPFSVRTRGCHNKCAPSVDHCLCCCWQHRRRTPACTVDSPPPVAIGSPWRYRSPSCGIPCRLWTMDGRHADQALPHGGHRASLARKDAIEGSKSSRWLRALAPCPCHRDQVRRSLWSHIAAPLPASHCPSPFPYGPHTVSGLGPGGQSTLWVACGRLSPWRARRLASPSASNGRFWCIWQPGACPTS